MAVIVQIMVKSDISGVLFTANVINNDKSQMMINSTWGFGDIITNNSVIPDTFIINKKEFNIIKTIIGKKLIRSISNPEGSGMIIVKNDEKKQIKPSLNEKQLRLLHKLGLKIEKKFNSPQDIEWTIENKKPYLLQTRPITTLS